MTIIAMTEAEDNHKMKDFTRPTLCVIDENGIEVTEAEISRINDENENRRQSLSEASHSDTADRLSFVQSHKAPVNKVGNGPVINGSLVSSNKYSMRDHNANVTSSEETDLSQLKATATRLKLSTRRQSYTTWRDQYVEKTNSVKPKLGENVINENVSDNEIHETDDGFTEDRKNRINEALEWLRNELQEMRLQDQVLARQLLSLRHEIHQIKLQRSCAEHREMLEDVTMDIEEVHEIQEISDIPLTDSMNETPLKHLGVTRMHLSARRFSTC